MKVGGNTDMNPVRPNRQARRTGTRSSPFANKNEGVRARRARAFLFFYFYAKALTGSGHADRNTYQKNIINRRNQS